MTRIGKMLALTIAATFAISGFCTLSFADGDPAITVAGVEGNTLLREVGEYMWSRPEKGQNIYAGDRLRLRNGELEIDFPQGSMTVFDLGELEIPVELADGYAEPWANDLRLYIGDYAFDMLAGEQSLKIRTLFGEIETNGPAKFSLKITVSGTDLNVFSGSVTVSHRSPASLNPQTVEAGNSAMISKKKIRLSTGRAKALPAS
jgi:hypothetical protein